MSVPGCERVSLADLTDYASGELAAVDVVAIETHLFACADCGARAAAVDVLVRGIHAAVRAAAVGGFVTDAVLNRLAREGLRIRTFTLEPGDSVRCAVWEEDELMALRLRADLGDASEITVSQRVEGREVSRTTGQVPGRHGEIVLATPAALIRRLPAAEVEVQITAHEEGIERPIARYTLIHGGSLHAR
jgi:anti-sigma factor RsiW